MKRMIFLLLILSSGVLKPAPPYWEYLGGPETGQITNIAINSKDHIFATSARGVFRTTNNGNNWELVKDKSTCFIDISPDDVIAIIYDRWKSKDVLYSKDNGDSWKKIEPIWDETYPFDIKFDSDDNLYVLTINSDNRHILYFTNNMGKEWKKCLDIPEDSIQRGEIFTYRNNKIIIAGNEYLETNHVLFISNDSGNTWQKSIFYDTYISKIEYRSDEELYMGCSKGFFHSEDGGFTWTEIGDLPGVLDFYFKSEEEIFCGTYFGIYYSSDKGASWQQYIKEFEEFKHQFIYNVIGDSKGNLFATPEWDGIYKSTDNGKTWKQSNKGLVAAKIYGITFDSKGNIYLGTYGVFKSSDNGGSWHSLGLEGRQFRSVICNKDDVLFASCGSYTGFYRSKDEGETWEVFHEGLSDIHGLTIPLRQMVINDKGYIFGASPFVYVYRSKDNGETWEQTHPGNSEDCIAINSEGHLFTGGRLSGKIYRTTNDGDTWEKVNEYHLGLMEIATILFDHRTQFGIALSLGQRYITTDNGRSWQRADNIITGFNGGTIDSIGNLYFIFDRILKYNYYYDKWDTLDTVPEYRGGRLAISPEGYIYLASGYAGIYRSREPVVSVEETPEQTNGIILKQNIPNPFEENTEISYYIDNPAFVRIKVYNLLGIEVAGYANEFMPGGWHTLFVNGSGLVDGVYILVLEADEKRESKIIHKVN